MCKFIFLNSCVMTLHLTLSHHCVLNIYYGINPFHIPKKTGERIYFPLMRLPLIFILKISSKYIVEKGECCIELKNYVLVRKEGAYIGLSEDVIDFLDDTTTQLIRLISWYTSNLVH